ncbi:hypothetical protein GGR54DRAFT_51170 [Hypoxylon sp. NC1633]|nr:hypothetical protein GGR54DRAFT_51170 [Hypoxylon sp. NC1633]
MRFTAVFAILAYGGHLAMAAPASQSTTLHDTGSAISLPTLKKRDAFACYGSTNTSVSDCQHVIDSIQIGTQQNFSLYSNICAVWSEGTCKVRFCAQPYVTRPVNRTATWLATYIASPLLDDCVSKGQMGVLGDHPNINSHAGTYRLWVY